MLSPQQEESLSKFMSKILRHTPEQFGVALDHEGFCDIDDLIKRVQAETRWSGISGEDIIQVVQNCPKQRYEIVNDYIRANYGHSAGRLDYKQTAPPPVLYHGTNTRVVHKILTEGIKPMGRKYVHLSEGLEFAALAGKRPSILTYHQLGERGRLNDVLTESSGFSGSEEVFVYEKVDGENSRIVFFKK